jgi:hypothetical protein
LIPAKDFLSDLPEVKNILLRLDVNKPRARIVEVEAVPT